MPFEVETLSPIPFLAELREEVLKHSLKRMPKWKFRFARMWSCSSSRSPPCCCPRLRRRAGSKPKLNYFEGVAVMAEGVTGEALKRLPKSPCPPFCQIKFQLFSYDPDADLDLRPHQRVLAPRRRSSGSSKSH